MKIKINRAPVLTLWAAVVAERLGHSEAEALTLGKALAGLNAQSKGRRLGLYAPRSKGEAPAGAHEGKSPSESIELMGRQIPVVRTRQGLRATNKGEPLEPTSVRRYLESKFGDHLTDVQQAMSELAESRPPAELASHAYALYEEFRPQVPQGERGWGAAGDLDLSLVRKLSRGERGKST